MMKKGKTSGGGRSNGLLPNSLRIISSCLKTVSSNASTVASTVRSVGASVASSISSSEEQQRDQVLWAGFDRLELGTSVSKNVLLLGYSNGFQVLDVEDASNVIELVSKRDGPVTFLQMHPISANLGSREGFGASQPLLLVVAGEKIKNPGGGHYGGVVRENGLDPQPGNSVSSPTAVRFYSLRSHTYVHVLRFRSAVYMVRCSPRIIAVGLAAQIYCFDAVTLESKFSVLTYPVPQVALGGQGVVGVNIGYGPMAVGPRWLAYASNNPLLSNMGRLSPQNLTPSPGVSPSTSPGNGSLMARYAMESSKQLAAGIITLGDMGYKTLSKYCQELLPDGSNSPVSSNSNLRFGRLGSAVYPIETDNAGMVVIKDFVSRTVISQFKAHTSPISALCFDPSGTLLVTASVHGNSINIFRIMPSCVQNGSSTPNYDWSSSHVHLYKLYRGITTAVIQDICFSHYSQWVAIVSSKGTCHIFVLSPFGGDGSIQTQNSLSDGTILLPGLALPWWSTSSCMMNQQSCSPPPPVTLSVVSRIKNGYSGWLNTVNNVATSATGRLSLPSGAVAAVFHNSVSRGLQPVSTKTSALEHLLVYSPCGHLIQHELLPSLGGDSSDSSSITGSNSSVQTQDEELRVKVEPVQWWHVCRRSDWPETEQSISGNTLDRQEDEDISMTSSDCKDNGMKYMTESNGSIGGKGHTKQHERPHLYLSNAEVQISSGRIPIWQKSKISFHVKSSMRANELSEDCTGGEIEIEKIPVNEVEIKQKDLLPVFDHFHSVKSDWNDRGFVGRRYPSASSCGSNRTKDGLKQDSVSFHCKPASMVWMDGSEAGSTRETESLLDLDPTNPINSYLHENNPIKVINSENGRSGVSSRPLGAYDSGHLSSLLEHSSRGEHQVESSNVANGTSKSNVVSVGKPIAEGAPFSNISGVTDSSSVNDLAETEHVDSLESPDFGQFFQEGYCKVSELNESSGSGSGSGEVVTDADSSSSHCEKEKPEDGENDDSDDMLGGVFAFSEDG